jgi:hypothetical protein
MNTKLLAIGLLAGSLAVPACAPTDADVSTSVAALSSSASALGGPGALAKLLSGPKPTGRSAAMQAAAGGLAGHINGSTRRQRISNSGQFSQVDLVLPHWSGSFKSQGTTFPYTVVGGDPSLGQTTTIQTVVIPYRLVFADGTVLDASADIIDGVTPLDGVMGSPIFQPASFSAGGKSLGTTQWGDAVLQAEFWNQRAPGGGYHVLLAPTVMPTVTLAVPADLGTVIVDPINGRRIAGLDSAWAKSALETTMASLGVRPDQLAIHLFSEVSLYTLNGGGSLGYHFGEDLSALTGVAGTQTYIQAGYFGSTSSFVAGSPEGPGTGAIGHELAEWIMDPTLNNLVPGWQFPTSPHLCFSAILEVGDPIEKTPVALNIPVGGRQYVLPDVALLPYFSRTQNTASLSGLETLLGTFTSPSIPCSFESNYSFGFYVQFAPGVPAPTVLSGINNTKGAVGYAFPVDGFSFGFQLSPFDPLGSTLGSLSPILVPVPGQPDFVYSTTPTGIADDGSVVGYFIGDSAAHGFLEQAGQYRTVDVPGAAATYVLGLDNRQHKDLVGQYFDAQGRGHGFVLRNGQVITIDAPSAVNTSVNAINDQNRLVGTFDTGGPSIGFEATLDDKNALSNFISVAGPAGLFQSFENGGTQLSGITNAGEVIGYQAEQVAGGAFIWGLDIVDGNFQLLNSGHDFDDAFYTTPLAINASGVRVGASTDLLGTTAYIWLPASVVLAGSAPSLAPTALQANLGALALHP